MPSDPINFFTALINSTPTLAAFLGCVYLIGRWFAAYMERVEQRDVDREKRYNDLVEKQLALSAETVQKVTEALTESTIVLKEVNGRLNAKSH